jgi:hypothetical protein
MPTASWLIAKAGCSGVGPILEVTAPRSVIKSSTRLDLAIAHLRQPARATSSPPLSGVCGRSLE